MASHMGMTKQLLTGKKIPNQQIPKRTLKNGEAMTQFWFKHLS